MASNNISNKTVLYTYKTPNDVIVTVYNDGSEAVANQTATTINYAGTATISVTDTSFFATSKKGAITTTSYLGDTIVLGNGTQTVTDTSHIDNG